MQLNGRIKNILRKLVYGAKADSDSYVKYLKSLGMKIGDRTTIYIPTKSQIDISRP